MSCGAKITTQLVRGRSQASFPVDASCHAHREEEQRESDGEPHALAVMSSAFLGTAADEAICTEASQKPGDDDS